MAENDIAASDRRRLEKLLQFERDDHLQASQPEEFDIVGAEWSAGFEDAEARARLSVYFIRDPAERNRIGQELSARGRRCSMNGGMLAVGSSEERDDSRARLKQLMSRFAGRE